MKKESITLLIYDDSKTEPSQCVFDCEYTHYAINETDFWARAFELGKTDIAVLTVDDVQIMGKIERLVDIGVQVVVTTHSDDIPFHDELLQLGVIDVVQIPFSKAKIRTAVMECVTRAEYMVEILMNRENPMYQSDLRIMKRAV